MTTFVNRYKQIRVLGSGSSSRVFEVHDQKKDQVCAFKLLKPLQHLTNSSIEDYTKEFEILKDLNHPNVAKVYDLGMIEEDGVQQIFLVTELIDGNDLFEATQNFDLDLYENLFIQSLRALNYIHQKDILHLDIKPQNILTHFNDKGLPQVKLIDFGLAKLKENAKASKSLGTQYYMSPEMIEKQEFDQRTDIYSLGRSFYKILTRDHPKDINNPEKLSIINEKIPEGLDNIILKMIQPDASKRYQNVTQILKDFQLLLNSIYEIETQQTNKSYLFSQKSFIGRDEEFLHFKKVFQDRFLSMDLTCKPFLFIEGEDGVGKSYFIKKCEDYAKQNFIRIMQWKDFRGINSFDELSDSCLILCDEESFSEEDLQYCEVFFDNWPYLFLFSTKKSPRPKEQDCNITLKPFDLDQTVAFIQQACDVQNLPKSLLKKIHNKTSGLPYHLTHYLSTLFEQGLLRDQSGHWSAKAIEDLSQKIANNEALPLIENHLEKKFNTIPLEETHYKIFYILTVYDSPSWEILHSFLKDHEIQNALSYLIEHGFLLKNPNLTYTFSNSLLKKVVFKNLDKERMEKICKDLTQNLIKANAPLDKILYFRGRSGEPGTEKDFLHLGKLQKQKMKHHLAKETFCFFLDNYAHQQNLKEDVLFELSKLELEMGNFSKASTWIEKLCDDDNLSFSNQTRAYELKGICEFRQGLIHQSTKTFEEALQNLKQKKVSDKSMEVILQSRLAQNYLDTGRLKDAETLFHQTWQMWQNDLTKEEKRLSIKNNIDTFYYNSGEYEKALACLNEYWRLIATRPDLESYGITLYKMARVHLKTHDLELAEYKLQLCLKSMKKNQSYHWLAMVYNELGILYRKKESYHKALESYQHAFDLQRKFDQGFSLYLISYNLGNVNFQLENWDDAQKFYKYASNHLKKEKENRLALITYFKCLVGLAGCALHNHNKSLCRTYLNQSEDLMRDHSLENYAQAFWQQKIELHLSEKNAAEFKDALEKLQHMHSLSTFDSQSYNNWLNLLFDKYDPHVFQTEWTEQILK